MKGTKTIEQIVADAVMQKPLGTFSFGDREYVIDRPRLATLVEVSALISRIPQVNMNADIENQATEVLRVAKDCRILAEIAAVIILGVKHTTEERTIEKRRLFGLIKHKETVKVNLREELADKLLLEMSPRDLADLISATLHNQQLSVFFGVITSLNEVNLLKPTSEVPTIASGH